MGPARRRLALLTVAALALTPVPAGAAAPRPHVTVAAAPSTAHVGSLVVLTGTVTPHAAATVTVQRLLGKAWHTIAHTRSARSGQYSLSLRTPHTAATWQLRVLHAKATSATVRVHVVTRQFTVRASVSATDPLTIVGTVTPKTAGTVALQAFENNSWQTLTTSTLTTTGAFTLTRSEPAGPYDLRVVKAFTTAIAAGTSATLHTTVPPPPAPPTTPPAAPAVTTTRLSPGTVGIRYSATLRASGGAAPLGWTIGSGALPAGMALSASGQISGTPSSAAQALLTVTVTDALGRSASLPLGLSVGSGVLRKWGEGGALSPTLVTGPGPLTSVTAGYHDWFAIAADHTIWASGEDGDGQLGNGSTTSPVALVHDTTLSGVVGVATGEISTYAVTSDGAVYSWGFNGDGELGNGTLASSSVPTRVLNVTPAVAVAANEDGGYAVRSDGTVWAWGSGEDGALGDGSSGINKAMPVQVAGLTSAVAVSGGDHTGYAVLANGTVAAWGDNGKGQLGDKAAEPQSNTPVIVHDLTGVVSVAATARGVLALKGDGTVWGWGYGDGGLFGDLGITTPDEPVQVPGLSGITAIATANVTGFALDASGTAWSWGANGEGQLGNGTQDDNPVPTPVSGLSHVVAIGGGSQTTGGFAVTWGGAG